MAPPVPLAVGGKPLALHLLLLLLLISFSLLPQARRGGTSAPAQMGRSKTDPNSHSEIYWTFYRPIKGFAQARVHSLVLT